MCISGRFSLGRRYNRNRVKTSTDVFGHVIEYSYDANSNRAQVKLDGNLRTAYSYDNASRLTTLTDDASQNFGYAYDIADRLISRTSPDGITSTFDHDGLSRLTQLKHQSASSTLTDNDFAYNTAYQISQVAELSQIRDFTYDNVNRITAMTNGTSNESYTFDGVGNRTVSHRSASYTYQPFNRMTATASSTMTYDSNGNLTGKSDATSSWVYSWDYENRMTTGSTAAGTVRYLYDGLGRRVERAMDGTLDDTKFIYDGLDVVMDDDFYTGVTKYQNGLGIDDKLSLKNGGVTKYFLQDHLGSTVAVKNEGLLALGNTVHSFSEAVCFVDINYRKVCRGVRATRMRRINMDGAVVPKGVRNRRIGSYFKLADATGTSVAKPN